MWAASCLASCCAACACDACRTVVSGISRRSARIAYCGLFALSLIVSWILREVAAPLMEKLPWINHFHKTPDREWFETDAVLRVSLGNFLFFTILAVLMVGVKNQKDPRDSLHHGGWMMKNQYPNLAQDCFFLFKLYFCWILFMDGMTNGLDMTNNSGILLCLLSHLSVIWQHLSSRDFFSIGSHHLDRTVSGSILPASVISFYCIYLCYSGLASEPREYECNGLHKHSKAVSTGTLTIGLFTTVLSVVYSAGNLYCHWNKAEVEHDEKEKAKPVTYSYAFFHIIFSLASMYSAMLLTGWSTSVGESGKLVDVGWPSVWVRIVTAWATAALYLWSLVAPIMFPEREF
ncbi:hypothetical protein GH714_033039 [Hevea brasiliensis]|uniref:Serine incorporator n=1 Tax=Hevea brasiliensis TaxID=3981 RepID=A0A6A6NDT2_HEVBR|nr:hypothetical protein GH714_033039 [Hevea brasiliensis]